MSDSPKEWHLWVETYLKAGDKSHDEIARLVGRSTSAVRRVAKNLGFTTPATRKRGPTPLSDVMPLSPVYRAIGINLTLIRGERTQRQMAEILGVSTQRYRAMEVGAYDYHLQEFLRMAETLNETFESLTKLRTIQCQQKSTAA